MSFPEYPHERKNIGKIVELLGEVIAVNEKILEKMDEICYLLRDGETGTSNLLKQSKIANKHLDELVDKRHG